MTTPTPQAAARNALAKEIIQSWAEKHPEKFDKWRTVYRKWHPKLQFAPTNMRIGECFAAMQYYGGYRPAEQEPIRIASGRISQSMENTTERLRREHSDEIQPDIDEIRPFPVARPDNNGKDHPGPGPVRKSVGYSFDETAAFGDFQALLVKNGYVTQVSTRGSDGLIVKFWKEAK